MVEVAEGNPIGFEPVFSNERFVGREDQIKDIEYYLSLSNKKRANYFNLLIVGSRGSGKSSLLNFIKDSLPDKCNYLFVNIDVIDSNVQKESLFFKEMLTAISQGLNDICEPLSKTQGQNTQELDQLKDEIKVINDAILDNISPANISYMFKKLLIIAKKLNKKSLVISFDDCDALAKNTSLIIAMNSIFSDLKFYFSKLCIGYQFIFLGTTESVKNMHLFTDSLKRVDLPYFSENEVKQCICSQLNRYEISLLKEKIYKEIYGLTNGCPRIVMVFTHFLYREFLENPSKELTKNSIDLEFITENSEVIEQVRFQLDTQYIDNDVRNVFLANVEGKIDEKKKKYHGNIGATIELACTSVITGSVF
jgi:hypothetical protein